MPQIPPKCNRAVRVVVREPLPLSESKRGTKVGVPLRGI